MIKKNYLIQAVLTSTLLVVPFVYADTTVIGYNTSTSGVFVPPLLTSVEGNIFVTNTGIVDNNVGTAIIMNANNKSVTLDPNNVNGTIPGVAARTGSNTFAITINAPCIAGANCLLTVGENTTVLGDNPLGGGVSFSTGAANITIDNAGTIQGDFIGISTTISSNIILNNQASGLVQGGLVGISINNLTSMDINNSGIIQSIGANDAIVSATSNCIVHINNNGFIRSNISGNAFRFFGNPVSSFLDNSGTMESNIGAAVFLQSGLDHITNTGTMSSTNLLAGTAALHTFTGGITIPGGITTSGIITANGSGLAAISLTGGANNDIPLIVTGGIITGDVRLDTFGDSVNGHVFTMTGGTINGNVTAFGKNQDTLDLIGGTITGTTTLANAGDVVNLSGTSLQVLNGGTGNDIFNVSGGSFTLLDGKAGADTLNVVATYSLNNPVTAVETIHTQNPGTIFTVNQSITGMTTQLLTDMGTSIIFNANQPALGGGAIQNNGTLQVNNGFTVTDAGAALTSNGNIKLFPLSILQVASFTQNAGSAYTVPIQNLLTGQLQTSTTATLQGGSTVVPQLIGAVFIPNGTTFDIIQAAPGGVTDNSTLVQPLSATFFFTKSGPSGVTCGANTCVRLTAKHNAFSFVALSDVAQAVGGALDSLIPSIPAINQDLINIIEQLTLLPTAQSLTDALESLAPPFNYGMVAGSFVGMDMIFEEVQDRMDDFHIRGKRKNHTTNVVPTSSNIKNTGFNYGDPLHHVSPWGSVLGAHLMQNTINHHAGYKAKGGGGAIGMDWNVNACTMVGVAGSFFKVNVDDYAINPKDETIQSWQTTAYSSFEFTQNLFLDVLLGLATNRYELNRIINVNKIHTGSQATFDGIQYGIQADFGSSFDSDAQFYIAPFARLKYVNLNIEDYAESGSIGLLVENHSLNQTILGVGVNLSNTFESKILLEPMLSAMIGYDFNNQGEQPTAAFIGGGPLFSFEGVKPGPLLLDLDIGLNASFNARSSLALQYRLEWRSKFVSNAGFVQFAYLWS